MKTLSFSPIPRNKLVSSQTLIHSSYIPIPQQYTPLHQSFQFSPMNTQKMLYSNQVVIGDAEILKDRRRSNSQSNQDNISGFSGNPPYLKALETKIKFVIEENDKLSRALEEKRVELNGFQNLESKVHILLEENSHLRQVLKEQGKDYEENREMPSNNPQENEDLMNKLTFMVQENEKLEGLIDSLQENFKKEMESYQQETENKLMALVQENERLNEVNNKYAEINEKFNILLQEDEKVKRIVEDRNNSMSEILNIKNHLEEILLDYEARIRILCEENEKLNDVLEHKLGEERILEPKVHSILGKNTELLKIINEKNLQLNELHQNNLHLKKLKSNDQSNINDYELQMYPIRAEHEKLKLKFADMAEENTRLLSEIQELKTIKENYTPEEFENLKNELNDVQDKLLLTNKEFLEQIKISENEKQGISQNLKEKCNLILEENEKLLVLIKDRNNEILDLKGKVENLSEQLGDSNQENNELKEKILRFKGEFEEFKVFFSLDEKRSEFLNSYEFKNLELGFKMNSDKCVALENEKEMAWNENEKLKEKLMNNSRIMSKEKIDIETAYNQLNQLAIEKDFLLHKLTDLEENQAKYENELNILNTQLTQWKNMNEHNKNEINKLYNILKARKNENQNLIQRNEEMQNEMNRLNKSLTELTSENFIFKEKVNMLEAEFEKTSVERNKWQEVAERLEENVVRFRKDIEDKVQDLEKLRQEYQAFVNNSIGNN